ncbi:MAG: DUF2155 domain-containing protein, partial [bacterium]|nr:DUF2155 domain-containing protein [bacterium]
MGEAFRKLLLLVSVVSLCLPCAAIAEESIAIMRVLDKITTRVSEVHAPTGVAVAFGSLRFTVRACHQSAPEDPPESKVFLEIWEDFVSMKEWDSISNEELQEIYMKEFEKEKCSKNFKQEH